MSTREIAVTNRIIPPRVNQQTIGADAIQWSVTNERRAQLDAIIAQYIRPSMGNRAGDVRDRLERHLGACLEKEEGLPMHPNWPGRLCVKEFARRASISCATIDQPHFLNRRLIEACVPLLGLKLMTERVGERAEASRALTAAWQDYLNRLERDNLRLPGKPDGTLSLRAAAAEAGVHYHAVFYSPDRRAMLEKVATRCGIRKHGIPRIGRLKVADLREMIEHLCGAN